MVTVTASGKMVTVTIFLAWVNRGKEPCRIAFILMDSRLFPREEKIES